MRFTYTGHQREADGQLYSKYRYLSPQAARWTQRDPFENLRNYAYTYVDGRPLTYVDPDGRAGVLATVGGAAVVIGLLTYGTYYYYYGQYAMSDAELHAEAPDKGVCCQGAGKDKVDARLEEIKKIKQPGQTRTTTSFYPLSNTVLVTLPSAFGGAQTYRGRFAEKYDSAHPCVQYCMRQHELYHHKQIATGVGPDKDTFELDAYSYEEKCLKKLSGQ